MTPGSAIATPASPLRLSPHQQMISEIRNTSVLDIQIPDYSLSLQESKGKLAGTGYHRGVAAQLGHGLAFNQWLLGEAMVHKASTPPSIKDASSYLTNEVIQQSECGVALTDARLCSLAATQAALLAQPRLPLDSVHAVKPYGLDVNRMLFKAYKVRDFIQNSAIQDHVRALSKVDAFNTKAAARQTMREKARVAAENGGSPQETYASQIRGAMFEYIKAFDDCAQIPAGQAADFPCTSTGSEQVPLSDHMSDLAAQNQVSGKSSKQLGGSLWNSAVQECADAVFKVASKGWYAYGVDNSDKGPLLSRKGESIGSHFRITVQEHDAPLRGIVYALLHSPPRGLIEGAPTELSREGRILWEALTEEASIINNMSTKQKSTPIASSCQTSTPPVSCDAAKAESPIRHAMSTETTNEVGAILNDKPSLDVGSLVSDKGSVISIPWSPTKLASSEYLCSSPTPPPHAQELFELKQTPMVEMDFHEAELNASKKNVPGLPITSCTPQLTSSPPDMANGEVSSFDIPRTTKGFVRRSADTTADEASGYKVFNFVDVQESKINFGYHDSIPVRRGSQVLSASGHSHPIYGAASSVPPTGKSDSVSGHLSGRKSRRASTGGMIHKKPPSTWLQHSQVSTSEPTLEELRAFAESLDSSLFEGISSIELFEEVLDVCSPPDTVSPAIEEMQVEESIQLDSMLAPVAHHEGDEAGSLEALPTIVESDSYNSDSDQSDTTAATNSHEEQLIMAASDGDEADSAPPSVLPQPVVCEETKRPQEKTSVQREQYGDVFKYARQQLGLQAVENAPVKQLARMYSLAARSSEERRAIVEHARIALQNRKKTVTRR
jgi:hypothetical protein